MEPRSVQQARGLWLLALLLMHEVHTVVASLGNRSSAGPDNADGEVRTGMPPNASLGFEPQASLFIEPTAAVDKLATYSGSAPKRELLSTDWNWEVQSTMAITTVVGTDTLTLSAAGSNYVKVVANRLYNSIRVVNVGAALTSEFEAGVVKLVAEKSDRTTCPVSENDVATGIAIPAEGTDAAVMGYMGRTTPPMEMQLEDGNEIYKGSALLNFMHGGRYKICYAPDGTFGGGDGTENVMLQRLKVLGVKSPCDFGYTDGCIKDERWECYYGYKGESIDNCQYSFIGGGGARLGWEIEVDEGSPSKMTWSATYGPDDTVGQGMLIEPGGTDPSECTSVPDTVNFAIPVSGVYLTVDHTTVATFPPVKSTIMKAFTVKACYCPNYNAQTGTYCNPAQAAQCCDSSSEYIQTIGTVYYWTIRICDAGPSDDNYLQCDSPYMRVVPQQTFVLRIECPPGYGCEGNNDNRVKFLDESTENNKPNWDENHPCKTMPLESDWAVWPSPSYSKALGGGDRSTFKVWKDHQVKINLSVNKQLDVCFANGATTTPSSWFRVGQVRTASNFGFASQSAQTSSYKWLKYVDFPGTITLYGGTTSGSTNNPYDGNKYSGQALLNMLSFDREASYGVQNKMKTLELEFGYDKAMPSDFQEKMDIECQKGVYSQTLVGGGAWSAQAASQQYIAQVGASGNGVTSNTVDNFLSFSGQTGTKMLQITSAGVIGVCYCAMVSPLKMCVSENFWIYAGRTTVRGPIGGQTWVFPTNIVVHMDVKGWGLSGCDTSTQSADDCFASGRDRLRIIDAAVSGGCTSGAYSPNGYKNYKLGCPSSIQGCRFAGILENIPMIATTANNQIAYLNAGVAVGATASTLTFSKPVNDIFEDGDMITLDPDKIEIGADHHTPATAAERKKRDQLAGIYEFQDTSTAGLERYLVAHRVTKVPGQNNQVTIPIGFPPSLDPIFTFKNDQGHWKLRNRISSKAEIKGTEQQPNLKVCWGVYENLQTRYYKEAGVLSFVNPPLMNDVKVSLTAKAEGAVAPVVITIETSDRIDYAQATGKTQLMLRFKSISTNNGKLIPRFSNDALPGGNKPEDYGSTSVAPDGMKQWVCGRLFLELWAVPKDGESHTQGFPLPVGCHYTETNTDIDTTNYYREVFIVFGERAGLRQNSKYQIVLNALVRDIQMADELIDLYAMCAEETGCVQPYKVFEKGVANSASQTEQAADAGDPGWGVNGFLIQGGDAVTQELDLTEDTSTIKVKLTGLAAAPIEFNQIIRMYLWPVTLWEVGGADCKADCVAYHASNSLCGGPVLCKPEEVVVSSGRRNIVKLTLPPDMDPITGTVTHTVRIHGLQGPTLGFLPTRVGAELRLADDTRPAYTTSSGYLMKQPEYGEMEGRLVLSDRTGFGPAPFAGDNPNYLYVRISLGATLHHNGQQDAASITITLPESYTCSVEGTGELPLDLPVFQVDHNADSYSDFGRGTLAVDGADGSWANSAANTCVYKLSQYNTIFAKQVFYVVVRVSNPQDAMQRVNAKNEWLVKLSGKGVHTMGGGPWDMLAPHQDNDKGVPFISAQDENKYNAETSEKLWARNAAVISKLSDVNNNFDPVMQPGDFRISTDPANPRRNILRIFFHAGVTVINNGYVIIDAPALFNFGQTCQAGYLADNYYDFIGIGNPRLFKLNNLVGCVGSKYPSEPGSPTNYYNRARLQVGGVINTGNWYGLTMRVEHPNTYLETQHFGWYLVVEDANEYPLEATPSTVKFNRASNSAATDFYDESFGMYEGLSNVGIQIMNLIPQSISQSDTDVIVYPILFTKDMDTSLRITAPKGYTWNPAASLFITKTNGTLEDFPSLPVVANLQTNQLVWTSLSLKGNLYYGFRAKISVPDYSPVTSSNSFFVEWGFQYKRMALQPYRQLAQVIEAPRVKAISSGNVNYASNLQGYENNYLELTFRTVTTLLDGDGIVIEGDSNTVGFSFKGTWSLLSSMGSDPLPEGVKVMPKKSASNMPMVVIKANINPILPGLYILELPVVNPMSKVLNIAAWTFGSYNTVSNFPQSAVVDKSLLAPGFPVNGPIYDARMTQTTAAIMRATFRNDRPGKQNFLIFQFKLLEKPESVQILTLRGPRGFMFEEDCSPVVTEMDSVFGPNSENMFPPDFVEWPAEFKPTSCMGLGRKAELSIPIGLERKLSYAFKIGVVNPYDTPTWNKWSIDYNRETSNPFEGFPIWTNTNMSVYPSTKARSPNDNANPIRTVNPVQINFRPYNRISFRPPGGTTGGLIVLRAPAGFEFVEQNDQCTVELKEAGDGQVFSHSDFLCSVDAGKRVMNVENISPEKVINGNYATMYQMIVYVYNPSSAQQSAEWQMSTFSKNTMEPETRLDESIVLGYEINNVLNAFIVSNMLGVYNGKATVDDVDFWLNFPDPIKDGDQISITSPIGFDISGNPDILQCNNFRWAPYDNAFPETQGGAPLCECKSEGEFKQCELYWIVVENKDPAYPQNLDIRFKIAVTSNPANTPFVTDNFWRISHTRNGQVWSSHVDESWIISPQLEHVDVKLVGAMQAASTVSDLDFIFTPVSEALLGTVKITVIFPYQFSFNQATVRDPFVIDSRTEFGTLIINYVDLIPGQPVKIRVNSVTLGTGGGQTRFDIKTFSGKIPDKGEAFATKLDGKLQFQGGFRLPGSITVISKTLNSKYFEEKILYPVQSLFLPRVDEMAKAEFQLSFTMKVMASHMLIIASEGGSAYTLRSEQFMVYGTTEIESSAQLSQGGKELQAELKPGMPVTEVALQADTPYTVVLWVLPKAGVTNSWRFTTRDGLEYPTNTNDGTAGSFAPVEQFGLTISVPRAPPGAEIDVELSIDPGTAVVRELIIIAPPSFVFPSTGCGDMCQLSQSFGSTGRWTATLASPTGEPLTNLKKRLIKVVTPPFTPQSITWYVQGKSAGGLTTVGWGFGSGFKVSQMANTEVMYPGVASMTNAQITVKFTLDVDAGSQIEVVPPTGYLLTCSTEGALRQISLPGKRPDCVDDPLELILDKTLTAGEYAFALAVDLPPETPVDNTFSIIIKNQENQVVDAAFQIPGQELVEISVESPTLSWSKAVPGQQTIITFGLTFTKPTMRVLALLLNFPDKFIHDVQKPTDVQNLNKAFRVAAGQEWADTTYTDRLRVLLDDSDPTTQIPPGTYTFNFPAMVPCCTQADMPKNNVWYVSLCSDQNCKQLGDQGIVITMPMAGFALNEVAPDAAKLSAGGAWCRWGTPLPSFVVVVSVLFAPLLARNTIHAAPL